ncbi:hypothetical protein NC651_009697 [Populus alba x Populus x berolinensis]|nr:hypothetical protein NC651_009697 [Populus alba x Populus x berolinensis]
MYLYGANYLTRACTKRQAIQKQLDCDIILKFKPQEPIFKVLQLNTTVVRFRRRRFGLIKRLRIDERLVGSWINSLAYQLLTQS